MRDSESNPMDAARHGLPSPEADLWLVTRLQTAITHYRSYPATTLLVERSIDRAFDAFEKAIGDGETLSITDSGDGLGVDHCPLVPEKDQRPDVEGFLETMTHLGIAEISLDRGIDVPEFGVLVEVLATSAGPLMTPDGRLLPDVADRLPHVRLTARNRSPEIEAQDMADPPEIRRVRALANAGDIQGALDITAEMIGRCARERDFPAAEALCKLLYQIDPLALATIISANDVVEGEKAAAVDPDHLQVWKTLHDTLTREETNRFYHGMTHLTVDPGQSLFRQGNPNRHLYFIDQGSVTLYHEDADGGRMDLVTLPAGQVVGEDLFNAVSVCTVSAMADDTARVGRLDVGVLSGWRTDAPGLFRKLETFCAAQKPLAQRIIENRMERRRAKRHKVTGPVKLGFLEPPEGGRLHEFQGSLVDVSILGVQVLFKTPSEEMIERFWGRRLDLDFELRVDGACQPVRSQGTVVAIQSLAFGESTLHLRLDRPIDGPVAACLEAPGNPEAGP